MTKEEISKHLLTRFAAEMEDATNYHTMAETAEKMGKYDLVDGLIDMAKDEYTHAEFIKMTMENMDVTIPDEHQKKWDVLEEKFKDLFQ